MRTDIKERWVNKLFEEGRKQAHGVLRDEYGGQCCLDVLCEIAVEDGVLPEPIFDEQTRNYCYIFTDNNNYPNWEYEILPSNVPTWAGLGEDERDPVVLYDGSLQPLSNLNDIVGLSLPEIGEVIKESDL